MVDERIDNKNEESGPGSVGESRGNEKPGAGWHGDPDGHAEAGRKGGESVSRNREHMSAIGRKGGQARKESLGSEGYSALGRKGGEAVSKNREHMSEIGKKGGRSSGGNFANDPERAREAGKKGGER